MQEETKYKIRIFYSPDLSVWPEYERWLKDNEGVIEDVTMLDSRYSKNVFQRNVYYKEKRCH
jgi:hypothetical protein